MQMCDSFERMLFFGAKLFIRVTPATRGTTFCNRETGLELGSRDAVEEKSLLMKLTDGEELIHLHGEKHQLALYIDP